MVLVITVGVIEVKPALAHAVVVKATPAPGDKVSGSNLTISLEFNTRIDLSRSRLTLSQPAGDPQNVPVVQNSAPNILAGTVSNLVPGAYSLEWLVLATDGHITRGEISFYVTP